MMKMLEEAIIYATILHQGKVRKLADKPFILHSIEVAQILSMMTDDQEVITAGILHDIVDDTDGSLSEIERRFGKRVAQLVASGTEGEREDEVKKGSAAWRQRKEQMLRVLRESEDIGVRQLWFADRLANIRGLAGAYSERGDAMWSDLDDIDPEMARWYYKSVAEIVELQLNRTGVFKEYVRHINSIWPGTFESDKARYKKYREISLEGCKLLGHGSKSDVYRYDEELVIKVFNGNNLYRDVEREVALSRKAFLLGIPTANHFGVVSVGDCWGVMYELVNARSVSEYIAKSPARVDSYAAIMAEVAHTIHETEVMPEDGFPDVTPRLRSYVTGGIGREDGALAEKCMALVDAIPSANTLIHGDFHTGNVLLKDGEPLIIDMDKVATGNPIAEIAGVYYYYVVRGEDDASVVEDFMGYPYEVAKRFYDCFLKSYLGTENEKRLREVTDKASLIAYTRYIRKLRESGDPNVSERRAIQRSVERIDDLVNRLDALVL
jgi:uncharacterized protein (TIGR02172 family)